LIGFTDNTYCCGTVNPYRKACFSCLFCILKDEARIQKVTKRMHTLEEVNNNVKLLNEMLVHYSKEDSSEADRELMKVGLSCCFPEILQSVLCSFSDIEFVKELKTVQ